ncbi:MULTISPECIES: acyl carrier protein [unclassified Streptomyces]|uniref:acyl carrier protein n=1 Tax=unclassified Streptomyces TaxID=2593676 RepID=UPI001929686C|nr:MULTISPECIES: acyl carrier protein [unclassified Streptomyces]MCW5254574.1 acyl carrier protein [Streptomyces sp. SHP 1-2]
MSATDERAADGVDAVVRYLLTKRPDLTSIDPDLDLVENRILDSLGFVNFLYVLEEQTGQEILMENVKPSDFRTINAIRRRFFHEPDESRD